MPLDLVRATLRSPAAPLWWANLQGYEGFEGWRKCPPFTMGSRRIFQFVPPIPKWQILDTRACRAFAPDQMRCRCLRNMGRLADLIDVGANGLSRLLAQRHMFEQSRRLVGAAINQKQKQGVIKRTKPPSMREARPKLDFFTAIGSVSLIFRYQITSESRYRGRVMCDV